jgi:hypothetical protein
VKAAVLKRCDISSMAIGGDTLADRLPEEVRYHGQAGQNPYSMDVSRMDAHGGWISTAADLVRFLVKVDGFTEVPDILTPRSLNLMTKPSDANRYYAKGWSVNPYNNWWHTGGMPGTAAIMARISQNFCWAALTNTRAADDAMFGELDALIWNMASVPRQWGL